MGLIGPSSATVGDHVGILGAEHFCCRHDFVVIVAKLLIVRHFYAAFFGESNSSSCFCTALYLVRRRLDTRLATAQCGILLQGSYPVLE